MRRIGHVNVCVCMCMCMRVVLVFFNGIYTSQFLTLFNVEIFIRFIFPQNFRSENEKEEQKLNQHNDLNNFQFAVQLFNCTIDKLEFIYI